MLTAIKNRIQRKRLEKDILEQRSDVSIESLFTQHILLGMQSASGIRVTPMKALGVSTVFACVNLLAQTIATLPLSIYRRDGDGNKEEDRNHPLYDILHTAPNEMMTSCDWRMAMQGNLALRNNSYAVIERNRYGDIVALRPVQPLDVQKAGGVLYHFGNQSYAWNEVIHLKGMSREGMIGLDLLNTVHDCIGLAIALEDNASKFFRNNSRPGGVLSHPGALSDRAYQRLKKEMEEKHAGLENAYKLMILEEGLKFEASRAANKDSQFDESRERQDRAIARIWRVPPHKLAMINSQPRANVEQENISFVTDTIRPISVLWEQQLNFKLLSAEERKSYSIEFNLEGLLRGDLKSRYDAYAIGRNWGWLSVNEIRRKENMNSIGPEGDVYLQPLNMQHAGTPKENGNEQEEG